MAIKADRSALPKAAPKKGNPPDAQPRFLSAYVEALQSDRDGRYDGGDKPTAGGTRLRHSDAGKCARALSLGLSGFPAEPIDPAGLHVFAMGEALHEKVQQAWHQLYGDDVACEVKVRVDGLDASGHTDAVFTKVEYADGGHDSDAGDVYSVHRITYELKTIGGFGYKLAVGDRGPAEGPRHSALVQGALNAYADDADELVIGLLATEAISKGQAARKGIDDLRRFVAEWTYTREQYEPIAKVEVARMQRILDLHDDGQLAPCAIPDPDVPDDALIVDPASGRWEVRQDESVVDTGSTWMCGYCAFQPVCADIAEPGIVSIDDARKRARVPF